MLQKMGKGRKKVVTRRQSNNSGIKRFNPVIGISTSQGECSIWTTDTRGEERARKVIHGGTAKQVIVIVGDINAQIGRNIGAYEKSNTVGSYGFSKTKPKGEDQHKRQILSDQQRNHHRRVFTNNVARIRSKGIEMRVLVVKSVLSLRRN